MRQPFASEADRHAYTKWVRAVAIIYGGVALILFGTIVLGKPSGVKATDHPPDRAIATAGASGAHAPGAACAVSRLAGDELLPCPSQRGKHRSNEIP